MIVEIINKASYGGELISLSEKSEEISSILSDNNIRIIGDGDKMLFPILPCCKIKSNKYLQKIIDIVEEIGDYDIPEGFFKNN
tara:strand:- start:670 stop:918 length:249 start_codon:yes stop_codon:yes gene_type:complete